MSESLEPIRVENEKVIILDQRYIPSREEYSEIKNLQDGFDAIKLMKVRGAPLIGFTAIYTMAVWCRNPESFSLDEAVLFLSRSRPTAVNLFYELENVKTFIRKQTTKDANELALKVIEYGNAKIAKANHDHAQMGLFAEKDLINRYGKRKLNILTHCNTGKLACGSVGTALGVIEHLHRQGMVKNVWVDETRPYLQGSRLTSFELLKENINHQIVAEGSMSLLMNNHLVDAIFVGADRIASNGDTANKIGTSNLSIIARYYNIPFYIVAPTSTFDMEISTGREIEIELRDPNEIKYIKKVAISHKDAKAFNPSFDISEGKNITGIICENGMISPVNPVTMKEVFNGN